MRLVAKKQSYCRKCSDPIIIGTRILWYPQYGAEHVECPKFKSCPNCNIEHSKLSPCNGGFDEYEFHWD